MIIKNGSTENIVDFNHNGFETVSIMAGETKTFTEEAGAKLLSTYGFLEEIKEATVETPVVETTHTEVTPVVETVEETKEETKVENTESSDVPQGTINE